MNKIEKVEIENKLVALENSVSEMTDEIITTDDLEQATILDNEIENMKLEITNLKEQLDNAKEEAIMEEIKNVKMTSEELFINGWKNFLVENAITVSGDAEQIGGDIFAGISAKIEESEIYGHFRKFQAGGLIVGAFDTTDGALVRGGTDSVATKTQQTATLDLTRLPQAEIYKLQALSHRLAKAFDGRVLEFIIEELAEYVVKKLVELALYDGTGASGAGVGFNAVVKNEDVIAGGALNAENVLASAMQVRGEDKILIVDADDLKALIADFADKNQPLTSLNMALGVNAVKVIDTASTNYRAIVMARDAYAVAHDDIESIGMYDIDINAEKVEAVVYANGDVLKPNGIAVFDASASA